uniref:FLYWCH-type domain-containing protein n=1 Tax=Meloidogyne enterolobii TaxID=390850 RepID=A0A6V7WUG3_MELEN|nr:unnamed protein product [Meloidogyne enterolobii]
MKLSIFLILYLFLTPHLVDSTNSDDETDEEHHFNPFQYRDCETSGTGTSGHGGTGTGSIPPSTEGYSQGMYSGTEHSQNLFDLNRGFGNNPFLNSPQHLQGNPSGQVPRNLLDFQLGYGNYPYQHQHTNPSGQESSQNWLNLDLTLGTNQSLYPTQRQHMNAEYPLGTNPSGQESSQNWLNLGLNPEMNTSNQTDGKFSIVKNKIGGRNLKYDGYIYKHYSHNDKKKTINWLCNKYRNGCKGKVVTKGVKFEKLKRLTEDELKELKIDIEELAKHTCVKKERIRNEELYIMKTKKGNNKLVWNGYEYNEERKLKNGNIHYICNKRKCGGRVIYEYAGDNYIPTTKHNPQYHNVGEVLGFDPQEMQEAINQSGEEYQRGHEGAQGGGIHI